MREGRLDRRERTSLVKNRMRDAPVTWRRARQALRRNEAQLLNAT